MTGGAGYIGALAVRELLAGRREVRVLDSLLHGQEEVAARSSSRRRRAGPRPTSATPSARQAGARRRGRRRAPRCDRRRSRLRARPRALRRGQRRGHARARGRRPRGRRRAPRVRLHLLELRPHGRPDGADRRGRRRCAPCRSTPSRRSAIEQAADLAHGNGPDSPTCLRFATVYGVAPRMRFDLTVNEFTRDLWADRELEVFGEQFWRPYVHVARRGARRSHRARGPARAGRRRGLQRRPLRRELPQARPRRGDRDQARPRQTSPTCTATRIRATTRSASTRSGRARLRAAHDACPTGSPRSSQALEEQRFGDPFDLRYSNLASAKRST